MFVSLKTRWDSTFSLWADGAELYAAIRAAALALADAGIQLGGLVAA